LLNISASALLCGFAFYLFIISNKYLKFTNILFIQLIGYVLHQLIGYIIFNESLSQYYILASFLLIVGILIQIAIPNQLKGLMVALLSTFLWAIGYSLMSIPLKNVSTPLSVFVLEITLLLMYYLLIFITKHKEQKIYLSEKNLPLFGVAFLTIFGSFLLNFTYKYYNMSQIGFLNLVIMPLFIFISLRVNKEKLSLKEIISNAIILLGYIMALL
jgi:drug/metabolite transporter (DMT)-like permease